MKIISIRDLYEFFQNCYGECIVYQNDTDLMKFFHDIPGMIVYKVTNNGDVGYLSVRYDGKCVEPNWESFSKDVVSDCTIRTIYHTEENNEWCIKEETV